MSSKQVPLLILLMGLILFRFHDLGIRPPHHDESVNGWFVDGLFKNGFYNYDPSNYHGPLYFYILALFESLFGRSIESLRSVTVVFGGMLSFVPFLYRRWIGERASWIAAFAIAVSPAVVFYSRYAIHEILFSFFCFLYFYFWLRARESEFNWRIMVGMGASLGAMASLKENFIILIGCLAIAEVMIRIYQKEWSLPRRYWMYGGSVLILFAIVSLVYGAFGRDEDGIQNFFTAFSFWKETGSKGNGHEKPIYYWLNVALTLEWPTLIGMMLAPLSLMKVPQSLRLISVTSVGMLMAYTIVNYKTPWCLLSFQWGFLIVFGYWMSRLWDHLKPLTWVLILITLGYSVIQAYDLSYVNVDADQRLYIYGQTYRTFMPPLNRILDRVKADPALKKNLRIQIISAYTWPLPFILGELENVAYHTEQNAPAELNADYLLVDEKLEEKYISRIQGSYAREVVQARQWASPMVIYTRNAEEKK